MTKKRWRPRQWMEMSSFLTWQAPGLIYYSTTKQMKWWSAYGYLSVRCHFQTSTWNRHRSMLVSFSSPIGSNFCSPLLHVPHSFQFSPFYILFEPYLLFILLYSPTFLYSHKNKLKFLLLSSYYLIHFMPFLCSKDFSTRMRTWTWKRYFIWPLKLPMKNWNPFDCMVWPATLRPTMPSTRPRDSAKCLR